MSRLTLPTTVGTAVVMVVSVAWTPAPASFIGNTYDGTGRLSVKAGKESRNENVNANLVVSKRKIDFDQTNGNSPLSGTLKLGKKVGNNAKNVNTNVKGSLANKRDRGTVEKGKFKIKENRRGIVSLNLNIRGKITKGNAKGGTFSIKVKG